MSDRCTELTCPHHGARNRERRRELLDEMTRESITLGTYDQPPAEERTCRWRVTVTASAPHPPTTEQMARLVESLPDATVEPHRQNLTVAVAFTLNAAGRADAISRGNAQGTAMLASVIGEAPAHTHTTAVLLEVPDA